MSVSRKLPSWSGQPAIVALAIMASATGITNGFAYDDRALIELNASVHSLHGWWHLFAQPYWPNFGGEAYRPITSLAYAIQWSAAGGTPWVFHAVSIAVYAATAVAVFSLARLMMPLWAAWLSAAFFAVHPVHVEAVANVTGQTELWVALAVVTAVVLFVRGRRAGRLHASTMLAIVLLYAMGLLSKEHAIVLPALLLVAEWLLVDDARSARVRFAEQRPIILGMVLVVVVFFAARSRAASPFGVVGFQTYLPFLALHVGPVDRVLTMLGVVPQWIRLLLWPAHLSSEYSPPWIPIALGASVAQLPGLLLLFGILALAVAVRRRNPAFTFGILCTYIAHAPTSNFFIPASFLLTERTLFLPSVGVVLAVGAALAALRERYPARALAIAGACVSAMLLGAGLARSANRSPVWRDNATLFQQAVVDAPLSYRAHYVLGALRFGQGRPVEGEREYRRALALFPYDPYLAYSLAEQYHGAGLCAAAVPLFDWANRVDPYFPVGHVDYADCLLRLGRRDDATRQVLIGIRNGEPVSPLIRLLQGADSVAVAAPSLHGDRADSGAGRRAPPRCLEPRKALCA